MASQREPQTTMFKELIDPCKGCEDPVCEPEMVNGELILTMNDCMKHTIYQSCLEERCETAYAIVDWLDKLSCAWIDPSVVEDLRDMAFGGMNDDKQD